MAWGLLVLFLAALVHPRAARACGAFAGRRGASDAELHARTPYLAVEQTLIVWDRDTFTEDFIREARFNKTGEPFGFVVPTPGKPEISKVDASPFDALRKHFPCADEKKRASSGGGARGGGGEKGADGSSVEVLSQHRIGSFDVTVLRATDAGELDGWLGTNGFAMTTEAQPWLRHYVDLRFFFVAFRYAEPPLGATDGMTSETVRIRFKSAAPFYPYLEPDHPAGVFPPKARMLAAWLVTQETMNPVVNRTSSSGVAWHSPWTDGGNYDATSSSFLKDVPGLDGAFPIRSRKLTVHAFRDLRTSRTKLGDVLFAYGSPRDLSREDVAALRPLLPILDPSITPAEPASVDGKKRPRCTSTVVGSTSDTYALPALLIAAAIAGARRLRRRKMLSLGAVVACLVAAVLLGACRRQPVVIDADNERAAVYLLSGKHPAAIAHARPTTFAAAVTMDKLAFEPPVLDGYRTLDGLEARISTCFANGAPAFVDVDVSLDQAGKVTSVETNSPTPMTPDARSCAHFNVRETTFSPLGRPSRGSFRMTMLPVMQE